MRYAVLVLQHFSGGKSDQIKYLVQQGCIPPLCELLTVHDAKIVTVALEGLENILKVHT
jgi:importin subunit alpha-6/7